MSFDALESWIRSIARDAGVEPVFDEDACVIQLGEDDFISITTGENDPNQFLLVMPLVELYQDPLQDCGLMRRALEINSLQDSTCGGCLAFGPLGGSISYYVPMLYAGLDDISFSKALDNFYTMGRHLREQLLEGQVQTGASEDFQSWVQA